MTAEEFAEILVRISGFTRNISLHVLGEPLLHPNLGHLLELAFEQGFAVTLTTNGTLLAGNHDLLIAAAGLRQINFSLHALAQLAPDSADAYLDDILHFSRRVSADSSQYVSLRLWNCTELAGEGVGCDNGRVLQRLAAFFQRPELLTTALRPGHGIALAPQVFLNPEYVFAWPSLAAPVQGTRGSCRGLRDHIAILADGTVVPCCLDAEGEMGLGTLFVSSLAEILATPRACRMDKGFADQHLVEPLCRRCTYRLRFGSPG